MFHSWSGKTVPQRDRHVPSCRSPVRTYKTGGAPLSTWPPIPMKSRGSWPSTSEGLKSFHPTPWPSPGCMPPGRAIIHMPARDRLRCRHFGHGRQIRQTGAAGEPGTSGSRHYRRQVAPVRGGAPVSHPGQGGRLWNHHRPLEKLSRSARRWYLCIRNDFKCLCHHIRTRRKYRSPIRPRLSQSSVGRS